MQSRSGLVTSQKCVYISESQKKKKTALNAPEVTMRAAASDRVKDRYGAISEQMVT